VANQLKLFMNEEDERGLLHFLERFVLEVYPRRVPPDWVAFRARAVAGPTRNGLGLPRR
jgi:hypothetical protein